MSSNSLIIYIGTLPLTRWNNGGVEAPTMSEENISILYICHRLVVVVGATACGAGWGVVIFAETGGAAALAVLLAFEGPLLFLLTVATAVARREYFLFFWMPVPALAFTFLVVLLLMVLTLLVRALLLGVRLFGNNLKLLFEPWKGNQTTIKNCCCKLTFFCGLQLTNFRKALESLFVVLSLLLQEG